MEKETYKKAKEILEKFATVSKVHHSRKYTVYMYGEFLAIS